MIVVQTGSKVTRCRGCKQVHMCGTFWLLGPICELHFCAACLEEAAAGVRSAESREMVRPAMERAWRTE